MAQAGKVIMGLEVLDGTTSAEKVVEGCNLLLVTGSVLSNGTLGRADGER